MRFSLLTLVILSLLACATHPVVDRAQCKAQGGTVQGVGMFATPACVIPYADAGKACSDKSDCLGMCKADPHSVVGKPATGTCQRDNQDILGCYNEIKSGRVVTGMCWD